MGANEIELVLPNFGGVISHSRLFFPAASFSRTSFLISGLEITLVPLSIEHLGVGVWSLNRIASASLNAAHNLDVASLRALMSSSIMLLTSPQYVSSVSEVIEPMELPQRIIEATVGVATEVVSSSQNLRASR